MQNEEWKKLARLAGFVYVPIGLLVLFIFALVEYQSLRIAQQKKDVAVPTIATTTFSSSIN